LIPLIAGAAVLLYSISLFSLIGRGTLSPADPPRHLVVAGMYRYVRNPMYVGVIAVLLGEALLFQSIVLLLYSAGVFLMFNLFVIFYEERALRRKFGESYEGYCRQVGRWLPRFTPYNESY
jgi:protein-S-isoprenylcysteine O-methyltransferase Ste14